MQKIISISKIYLLNIDLLFPALAFSLPFLLSRPQWLTGTFVNCYLFLYVSSLNKKYKIPALVLPSIGALLHGTVFGPFTPFLVFFLPFIWLGNYLLVWSFEKTKNLNSVVRIVLSSIVKASLLFSIALVFVNTGIAPKLFISSMGLIQLLTAILGGVVSLIISNLSKKYE